MTSALSLQLVLCSLAEVKPGSTVIHRALHLSYMCLELNYATKRVRQCIYQPVCMANFNCTVEPHFI